MGGAKKIQQNKAVGLGLLLFGTDFYITRSDSNVIFEHLVLSVRIHLTQRSGAANLIEQQAMHRAMVIARTSYETVAGRPLF